MTRVTITVGKMFRKAISCRRHLKKACRCIKVFSVFWAHEGVNGDKCECSCSQQHLLQWPCFPYSLVTVVSQFFP